MRKYCDKQLSELRASKSATRWLQDENNKHQLSPWALDLTIGIRNAYERESTPLKTLLMNFIWDGRAWTLGGGVVSTTLEVLKDTPAFVYDLLGDYATRSALYHHRSTPIADDVPFNVLDNLSPRLVWL
jgi:hypothetical protein